MAAQPGQADQRSLLEVAVDAHNDLTKLATGLAHAGGDPQAVSALQHMADILAEVVKLLGAGPVGAAGQHGEAPGQAAQAPAQAPQEQPQQAAPQAAAGPPQGPTPGARPNGFHEAAAQLQAALASRHAAAQRALAAGQ